MKHKFSAITHIFDNKEVRNWSMRILGYLLIIFILYPGLFINFNNKVPYGDHGDVLNILSIIDYSIHTPINSIYHLPFLYPESYLLTRTHPLIGISFFFKVFEFLGFNLAQSYNLYIILSLLLGAAGCFLLIREFTDIQFFPFVFSALYIIHWINGVFFHWLNFVSSFSFPFIVYFYIKYLKTKKYRFFVLFTLFSCFLFISSIYYGVNLWVFIFPALLLAAIAEKILSFKELKDILFIFIFGAVLVFFILSPYMTVTQQTLDKKAIPQLLEPADLFSYSRIMNSIFGSPEHDISFYFPGFTVVIFALFFLASLAGKKKRILFVYILLVFLLLVLTSLAHLNLGAVDSIFLLFVCFLFFLVVTGWSNLSSLERVVLFAFAFFSGALLVFPNIKLLGTFSLFKIFSRIFPISGLQEVQRAYILALPFLMLTATLGFAKAIKLLKPLSVKKRLVFSCVVLTFMMIENFPFRHPLLHFNMMTALPQLETDVYKKLPYGKNKILLEIPFYADIDTKNSLYSLHWRYHKNSLINGKISVKLHNYYLDLLDIIGVYQLHFPNEIKLRRLIRDYSATHIIFHWDLFKEYTQTANIREIILPQILSIKDYGKILYDDEKHTILETREFAPTIRITRTFSLYHLKSNDILVKLADSYSGRIHIYLNNRLIEMREIDGNSLRCSLQYENLNIYGNRIEIVFSQPIQLNEIQLISSSSQPETLHVP